MVNVSAIIVTRGNVDLDPILDSLPNDWECVIWNNGAGYCRVIGTSPGPLGSQHDVGDLAVYGRYAAIEYASHDVIYVQDDDCIVSDPQAIVDTLTFLGTCPTHGPMERAEEKGHAGWVCEHCEPMRFSPDAVVCNQPEPWRSNPFYADHALVGFGASFHRDAPDMAFSLMVGGEDIDPPFFTEGWGDVFQRTCDIVFTGLTPRVLVDIPHTSFDYASDPDRMWRQPTHQPERQRMLDLVLQVKRAL